MKLLILFIMVYVSQSLNINNCPITSISDMVLHACEVEPYKKVYFHDVTGENQITTFPNRLYSNHGMIVAAYKNNILYIGGEKYETHKWSEFFDGV